MIDSKSLGCTVELSAHSLVWKGVAPNPSLGNHGSSLLLHFSPIKIVLLTVHLGSLECGLRTGSPRTMVIVIHNLFADQTTQLPILSDTAKQWLKLNNKSYHNLMLTATPEFVMRAEQEWSSIKIRQHWHCLIQMFEWIKEKIGKKRKNQNQLWRMTNGCKLDISVRRLYNLFNIHT